MKANSMREMRSGKMNYGTIANVCAVMAPKIRTIKSIDGLGRRRGEKTNSVGI